MIHFMLDNTSKQIFSINSNRISVFIQGFVNLYFAIRLSKTSALLRRLTQEMALQQQSAPKTPAVQGTEEDKSPRQDE